MGVLDEETIRRIKLLLKRHPKGMMISDLSQQMKISRNIMAKYLEMLQLAGQVEMEMRGNAKVYSPSKRAPLSALFESSSDCILLLDGEGKILRVNGPVLTLSGLQTGEIEGRPVHEIDNPFFASLHSGEHPGTGETVTEISFEQGGEVNYYRVKKIPAVLTDGSNGSILSCEDITSEVVFQQMVERSEARFRAIVEDQTEFIARYLPDGKITFVNGSCARFWGKKPEEFFGTPFYSLFRKEDAELLRERGALLDPDHPLATVECRIAGPDGSLRQQEWTVRALFDKENRITEYQVVGRDITEQTEAKERMRRHAADMEFISGKAREFLELSEGDDIYSAIAEGLSEIIPDAAICVSSCDPAFPVFTIRNVSGIGARETFRRVTGTDIVGFTFTINDPSALEIIRFRTLNKAYGDLYTALFGQMPYLLCKQLEEELGLGEIYFLGLMSQDQLLGCATILPRKGHPVPSPGLIEAFIHQSSLVLAWRRADEAVRMSEARFRAIIEDQTEFITRFLPDGTLIFANAPLCRAAGVARQDLLGRSFFSMIPDDDRQVLLEGLQSITAVNPKMEIRHRFIDPEGRIRWFQWTNCAIFDDHGHIVEYDGIGRDITDLQEATNRIRNHPSDLQFLTENAKALVRMQVPDEIRSFTARKLRSILPGSLVGICSYSPVLRELSFRCLEGNPEDLSILKNELGHNPAGTPFAFNAGPELLPLLSGGRIAASPLGIGPFISPDSQDACLRIEERCNFGRSYVMGLPCSDGKIESVLIQLKAGTDLLNPELAEAAISQAGLALTRAQYR